MDNRIPERRANLHINIIIAINLLSSIWQFLFAMQGAGCATPACSVRYQFTSYLGTVTFLVAVCLFTKINFFRLCAIGIAWCNLVASPLVEILENIYLYRLGKTNYIYPKKSLIIIELCLVVVMIAVRVYIIYMLSVSKAGYIFTKEFKEGKS
jgi:hypothetical protein